MIKYQMNLGLFLICSFAHFLYLITLTHSLRQHHFGRNKSGQWTDLSRKEEKWDMPKMSNRKERRHILRLIYIRALKTQKIIQLFYFLRMFWWKRTFSCCVLYCFVLHRAGSFIFILMPVFWMPLVLVRARCPRLISQDPGVMSYNNLNIS